MDQVVGEDRVLGKGRTVHIRADRVVVDAAFRVILGVVAALGKDISFREGTIKRWLGTYSRAPQPMCAVILRAERPFPAAVARVQLRAAPALTGAGTLLPRHPASLCVLAAQTRIDRLRGLLRG